MVDLDVALLLEQAGIGIQGTDLFASELPDDEDPDQIIPANLIALYENQGRPPVLSQDGLDGDVEQPMLQILVRDVNKTAGRQRIEAIYRLLRGSQNLVLNGTTYQGFIPQQTPFFLMRDESERAIHSVNFLVLKDPDTLT